jgi:hypothetical protein
MVDEHFVINPVKEGTRDKDWLDLAILPASMTALGAYFAISGKSVSSRKLKQAQKTKEKGY